MLDKGGEELSPSTSMASSSTISGAIMETEEGFLDLGRFVGLVSLLSSAAFPFVDEDIEVVFLCPFEAPLE